MHDCTTKKKEVFNRISQKCFRVKREIHFFNICCDVAIYMTQDRCVSRAIRFSCGPEHFPFQTIVVERSLR